MNKPTRPHWSFSSVSQYIRCPLQFYFERVQKLPRKSVSDAQLLGSALHSALAEYHRDSRPVNPCSRTRFRMRISPPGTSRPPEGRSSRRERNPWRTAEVSGSPWSRFI